MAKTDVTETIDQALEKHSEFSKEQKESLKDVLVKVFQEGQIPAEAMGVDKDLIEGIYALAYHNYQIGKYEDASAIFDFLYSLNPIDERVLLGSAACFQQLGQYDQAIERYLTIVSYNDDSPLPYFYTIDCYMKKEVPMAALMMTDWTLRKAKNNPELYAKIIDRTELIQKKLLDELDLDPEILEGPSAFDQLDDIPLEDIIEALPPELRPKKKIVKKKIVKKKKILKSPES